MNNQEAADGAEKEFSLGKAALDREDTLVALTHLERALRLQSTPGWYSYLGYCSAKERGQFRKGVELCQRSLAQEPDHPGHYYNLGRVHLASGDKIVAAVHKAVAATEAGKFKAEIVAMTAGLLTSASGVPVEAKAQAIRVMPASFGSSRVGVSIIESKESWLRLFVAWIADDNVVEGIDE